MGFVVGFVVGVVIVVGGGVDGVWCFGERSSLTFPLAMHIVDAAGGGGDGTDCKSDDKTNDKTSDKTNDNTNDITIDNTNRF